MHRRGEGLATGKPSNSLDVPVRILTSDAILRGQREIGIEHDGALYRLKLTRQGKLILNK
ncbi:hemin uptake protein HemP [Aquamicrobium segne]|uniref:Hemin uptake protein HemP n=1 Tax=Aquamicrobium segne TaxID=469547 RepID=A0ABW0GY71_9HYPH